MKFSLRLLSCLVLMLLLGIQATWADSRVARVTKGIFLYSNWDAPYVTLDTCLDMTITEAHIPASIEHNGRTYPVIEIGPGAFKGCHNLAAVYFNDTIRILREAFHDCPNLKVLVSKAPAPASLDSYHLFYGGKFADIFESYHAQQVIVVVPPGCEETYRNAPGWCNFRNIQSTMPTDAQLMNSEREGRIIQLQSRLERARAEVRRLEEEINRLRQLKTEN